MRQEFYYVQHGDEIKEITAEEANDWLDSELYTSPQALLEALIREETLIIKDFKESVEWHEEQLKHWKSYKYEDY